MTDPSPPRSVSGANSSDATIRASLERLVRLLPRDVDSSSLDAADFETFCDELRRLHARIRMHHAAICLEPAGVSDSLPPELAGDRDRLVAEYSTILNSLDHVIRLGEFVVDRPVEDKDVFFLRIDELIAVLRRHMAEEDRLFYLAVWREIGGES